MAILVKNVIFTFRNVNGEFWRCLLKYELRGTEWKYNGLIEQIKNIMAISVTCGVKIDNLDENGILIRNYTREIRAKS